MLEKQEEGRNSQFLYGCDTDWNLNHELICWLKYWFKVYKEKTITDLSFHKFEYKGKTMTQEEIIDRVIELCDFIDKNLYEFDMETEKKIEEKLDELFDLLKLVWGCMWW